MKAELNWKGHNLRIECSSSLLRTEKKLRKAEESQNWPSHKEEDEDDEHEVGEKRKKTENDCGMEEFKKFFDEN